MADIQPPLNNGRYRLIEILGEGGMATVYRAYDERLDVDRAIKVLNPDLAKRKSIRKRFENEARTMAKLHHHNMVMVHDVDEDGDRVYIVMELIEGGSVIDYMKAYGPLPQKMACEVAIAVCDALEVAHSKGVIHRDIKPHNVLVTEEGVPKVTDFGIAQMGDGDSSMTKTGAVMGTWAYMAPEQRVSAKEVDARSDVYAVGATLYAMLKNEEPFDIYTTELHDELYSDVPDLFEETIKQATRYRQNDRYSSAKEFADALRALLPKCPEPPPDAPTLGELPISNTDSTMAFPVVDDDQYVPTAGNTPAPTYQLGEQGAVAAVPRSDKPPPTDERPRQQGQFTIGEPTTFSDTTPPQPPGRSMWFWVIPAVAIMIFFGILSLGGAVGIGAAIAQLGSGDTPTAAATAKPKPKKRDFSHVGRRNLKDTGAKVDGITLGKHDEEGEGEEDPDAEHDEGKAKTKAGHNKRTAPAPAPTVRVTRKPTPAPAPAPAVTVTPKPAPAPAANAMLYVASRPWSMVTIDGRSKGNTMWKGQLSAGKHTVKLVTAKGETHTESVTLAPNETKRMCWSFTLNAQCPK